MIIGTAVLGLGTTEMGGPDTVVEWIFYGLLVVPFGAFMAYACWRVGVPAALQDANDALARWRKRRDE